MLSLPHTALDEIPLMPITAMSVFAAGGGNHMMVASTAPIRSPCAGVQRWVKPACHERSQKQVGFTPCLGNSLFSPEQLLSGGLRAHDGRSR